MAVTVVFLGPLRDTAATNEMTLDSPVDWAGLLEAVPPSVANQLTSERINIACAGAVLADKTTLCASDGDEIALLPPVSGG